VRGGNDGINIHVRVRTVRQAGVLWFSRTFSFCIEGNAKRTNGAQKQPYFSPRLALLHVHDPLSADTDSLGQRPLVEAKLGAVVTYESPEIGRRSNAHISSFRQMSAFDDIVTKSAIGDNPKSQRPATRTIKAQ
jgi:hypothetical protein